MLKYRQQLNWILDTGLLVSFLAAFFLDSTGVDLHQWLGVGLALGAGIHLILHWNWVKSVTAKLFNQIGTRARDYYLVDATLLIGFGVILVTGVIISTWLDLDTVFYPLWRDVHVFSSVAALLVLVLKVGLHWRWIVTTAQRMFTVTPLSAPQSRPIGNDLTPKPAVVPVFRQAAVSRRHFISLMGIVGISAWVAISNLFREDDTVQAEALPAAAGQTNASAGVSQIPHSVEPGVNQAVPPVVATASIVPTPTPKTNASTGSVTGGSCRVLCNKRCAYPGKCRKYVDRNNNRLCDLGECL